MELIDPSLVTTLSSKTRTLFSSWLGKTDKNPYLGSCKGLKGKVISTPGFYPPKKCSPCTQLSAIVLPSRRH